MAATGNEAVKLSQLKSYGESLEGGGGGNGVVRENVYVSNVPTSRGQDEHTFGPFSLSVWASATGASVRFVVEHEGDWLRVLAVTLKSGDAVVKLDISVAGHTGGYKQPTVYGGGGQGMLSYWIPYVGLSDDSSTYEIAQKDVENVEIRCLTMVLNEQDMFPFTYFKA